MAFLTLVLLWGHFSSGNLKLSLNPFFLTFSEVYTRATHTCMHRLVGGTKLSKCSLPWGNTGAWHYLIWIPLRVLDNHCGIQNKSELLPGFEAGHMEHFERQNYDNKLLKEGLEQRSTQDESHCTNLRSVVEYRKHISWFFILQLHQLQKEKWRVCVRLIRKISKNPCKF